MWENESSPPYQLDRTHALAILKRNEELFSRAAIEEILTGFTDDVVVQFADVPAIQGKDALARFLTLRFARQKNYRLTKTLRAVNGSLIVGSWIGTWEDALSGAPMQGRGIELLEMRDRLCARWEATFNAWDMSHTAKSPFV